METDSPGAGGSRKKDAERERKLEELFQEVRRMLAEVESKERSKGTA